MSTLKPNPELSGLGRIVLVLSKIVCLRAQHERRRVENVSKILGVIRETPLLYTVEMLCSRNGDVYSRHKWRVFNKISFQCARPGLHGYKHCSLPEG